MPRAAIALDAARGEAVTYTGTHYGTSALASVVDITGWTIKVTARDAAGSVVLSKTATITSGVGGIYTFSVTTSDTKLAPGVYAMDIQRTDSGSEKAMGVGTWTIASEVLY